MIERYTLPEMGKIWTDDNRFQKWMDVELAVCEAWNELGEIPDEALQYIRKNAKFSVKRILEIESVVKHDVVAFTTSVADHIGDYSRFFHLGLTSYDVVDNAISLLMKEALEKVRKDVVDIQEAVRSQAVKYKMTPMVGRTHGVHAEPITFGVKILVWFEEFKRHLKRIDLALDHISVGRIAGSVGTFIHLDPEVERIALQKLGLKTASVSTQILQRDRHAEVISVLALVCATLDKIATEIRHLQKTEVLEIEETFSKGQKGSSSMPHKRNPVRCERISGLARIARSNLQTALENIPLWHERDISHSSAERIIVPDTFVITDFLLHETSSILQKWHVYPERMTANIDRTRGLVFSQMVLTALTKKDISREKAYELVQKNSLKAWNEGGDFCSLLKNDKEVTALLTEDEIDECFLLEPYMSKIDFIFNRVLKDES